MKLNNKIRYRSMLHSSYAWRLKNGCRMSMPVPSFIQEKIREIWMEKQREMLDIQVHTLGLEKYL